MKTLLFTVPLKPGMLAAYRIFAAEIIGPRKREFSALLKRYGLKNSRVWYQELAGQEYMMILHDAKDDALERLNTWASSTHPFDHWFDAQLKKCYVGHAELAECIFEFS